MGNTLDNTDGEPSRSRQTGPTRGARGPEGPAGERGPRTHGIHCYRDCFVDLERTKRGQALIGLHRRGDRILSSQCDSCLLPRITALSLEFDFAGETRNVLHTSWRLQQVRFGSRAGNNEFVVRDQHNNVRGFESWDAADWYGVVVHALKKVIPSFAFSEEDITNEIAICGYTQLRICGQRRRNVQDSHAGLVLPPVIVELVLGFAAPQLIAL